jgi:hypothetical protein
MQHERVRSMNVVWPRQSHTTAAWPLWPLRVLLVILSFGPPVAALFMASSVPVITDAGHLARTLLSTYICPTPALSYQLGGAPMAVCARCWGATLGLWLAWFGVWRGWFGTLWQRYLALEWPLRLLLALMPFGLWVAEINAWPGVWPGTVAPYPGTLLNGIQAGIVAGVFFCSIWPGVAARMRQASVMETTVHA